MKPFFENSKCNVDLHLIIQMKFYKESGPNRKNFRARFSYYRSGHEEPCEKTSAR